MKLTVWVAVAAALSFASTAEAGAYLSRYSDWSALSYDGKLGYVMGLFDGDLAPFVSAGGKSNPDEVALRQGIQECMFQEKISSSLAVQMIDGAYKDVANWPSPPYVVFADQEAKLCRSYINASRGKMGLRPLN